MCDILNERHEYKYLQSSHFSTKNNCFISFILYVYIDILYFIDVQITYAKTQIQIQIKL